MKKTLIAISTLLFSVSCFAQEPQVTSKTDTPQSTSAVTTSEPIEMDKQYIVLPTYPSPDKEVIEFFSFNCPSCFKFETEYHGSQAIAKNLPESIKFKRYHLIDFGPLAMELAQAWAVANVLDIQDKALDALYFAVQRDHKIKTAEDIKAVFKTLGVDEQTYDKTKDNFLVKAFMAQQIDAIKEMKPTSIPTVVVNRKFYINPQALDRTTDQAFINDYARVAAFLVNLDPNVNPDRKLNKK
ncbi:DsbA family protein [uncultured Gilliamella sp.]|jgi:Protein-disulfide isomerase|uniref:DsbA family protein n=1 Tax=uncultured Gilliamella sp. TaxID=1193505 RepID=UPI0025DDF0B7|nr:DsbA family protein [uncultured Gilliamella sp.]